MAETILLRPAVFLDRDGTICKEIGYVSQVDRLLIFPFAAAIRQLNEAHWPVIVVTNQSGVARGIFPESLLRRVHEKMIAELTADGEYELHRVDWLKRAGLVAKDFTEAVHRILND